jgi:hypothetical protein
MIQPNIYKAIYKAAKEALRLNYLNSTPYKIQFLGLACAGREQSKRTITNSDVRALKEAILKADFGKDSQGNVITVEDLEVKLSKVYMPLNHTGFVLSAFIYLNEEESVIGYQLSYDLHTRIVALVPLEK